MVACSMAACGTQTQETDIVSGQEIDNIMDTDVSEALAKEIGIDNSSSGKTDTKEETVYVFTDATGAKNSVLVNEKLKNASAQEKINDMTTLSDIVNLTGDEEYTAGSGDAITWNADGNDITYRGTTDKDMPVDIKVTYYLDDKEISPEDIAGKSGRVKIRFDYTNNEKRTITANGKTKEAYVPFSVVTGMVLSNDNFANIEVENGKVTETGSGTMVIGFAMPGMKESLDLTFNDKELDIDIPEYFEVTADAVDFQIDMIMSMVTSNLVTDVDLDDLDMGDLKDDMSDLKDATGELIDGTKELQDGTQELQDNMPDLDDGLTDLNNGAGDLLDGAIQIDEGAGTLGGGIYSLSDSVEKKLVPGIASLTTGAKQVSDGVNQLAATINGMGTSIQAAKAGVYAKANAGLAANDTLTVAAGTTVTMDNIDTVIAGFSAKRAELEGYAELSDQAVCIAAIMIDKQCDEQTAANTYASFLQNQPDSIPYMVSQFRTTIKESIASLDTAIETLTGVKSQVDGAVAALDSVAAQLSGSDSSASLKQLSDGAAAVSAGMAQLQTSVGTFDQDSIDAAIESENDTICSGLYKLKEGADKLSEGTKELRDGCNDLKSGTQELRDSGNDLIDGVKKLNDGAIELKDGVIEYDEDGIQKLTALVDDDAEDVIQTLKAVIQLGKDYTSFAGKEDSWDGSVVFIYKIEGISSN
jgi:putative membrane protein